MEGSESEAVFSSLNLNPQSFINETRNSVDILLDDAFNFFHREASRRLKIEGSERSQHLKQGIDSVRHMVQSELDKRLDVWGMYCLRHCFEVPEGFSLPKNTESPNQSFTSEDVLSHPVLDSQLDSLRERLAAVSRESVELNRELQDLERKSAATDRSAELVAEVLQSYDQTAADNLFQELLQTASELRQKLENLKVPRPEGTESSRAEIGDLTSKLLLSSNKNNGLSNVSLEELEGFLGELKKHENGI